MLLFMIAYTPLVRFSQTCKGIHLNRVTLPSFMKPWSVSSYVFDAEDVNIFFFGFGSIKVLYSVINNFQLHTWS